jgi:O-antigen/teichoic acid export membrane protein
MNERRWGVLLAYGQIFVNIAVALLFTPFLVHSLGQAGYGLFAIVGSFAAYLSVLDMGMNDSVIRYIVRHRHAAPGEGQAQAFLASMLTVYSGLGALVVAGAFALVLLVPALFGRSLGIGEQHDLAAMVLILGFGTAATVATNPVGAVVNAYERFVFLRVLETLANLVATAVTVVLLIEGFGPVMVVAVMAASLVATAVAKAVYVRLRIGLRLRYGRCDWRDLRPVLAYSAPIFLAVVVEQIFWRLDNILIGAVIGASAVAIYAIGVMFNKYFMSFATAVSRVLMPDLVRRIDGGASGAELTSILVRVSRIQALVLFLVLAGLGLFGREFLRLWLGPGFDASYAVLLFALCPYALELVGNVRNVILQVKGLYWYRVGIFGAMALLNIPLTLLLLRWFGVVGAAMSTGIGILGGYVAVAMLLHRRAGLDMAAYFRGLWKGIGPALVLSVAAGLGVRALIPLEGWPGFLARVAAFVPLYAGLMWTIGMNAGEKAEVVSVTSSMRRMFGAR